MLTTIANGNAGVRQTLDMMSHLIRDGERSPDVISAARSIASLSRAPITQLRDIRFFLSQRWRFVADPLDTETLAPADVIIDSMLADGYYAGDCDEAAIIAGAMARAIGCPVQLVALAFPTIDAPGGAFSHVYTIAIDPQTHQRVQFDITRPSNRSPSEAVKKLIIDV